VSSITKLVLDRPRITRVVKLTHDTRRVRVYLLLRNYSRSRVPLICAPCFHDELAFNETKCLCVGSSGDALYRELWHACAGPLVTVPRQGERVYYFPQGHMEQVYLAVYGCLLLLMPHITK
jgi:hypothetical protein